MREQQTIGLGQVIDREVAHYMVRRQVMYPTGRVAAFGVTLASFGGALAVICTELPDNPGSSITNGCEIAATRLRAELRAAGRLRAGESIEWFEHHPVPHTANATTRALAFTRIHFAFTDPAYRFPTWLRASLADIDFDRPAWAPVPTALPARNHPLVFA